MESDNMNDVKLPNKKIRAIALLALLIGIVAIALADEAVNIATYGANCTGNCSFDAIKINALEVNSTSDNYIHLLDPLVSITGDDYKLIELDQPYMYFLFTNLSTVNASSMILSDSGIELVAANILYSIINIYHDKIQLITNNRIYNLNQTHFDMGGANLTNCSNCGLDNWSYVNETFLKLSGGYMTGNIAMGMNKIENVSFVDIKRSGTAGFDIQNTGSYVVNSLAVGSVGNMNLYGNVNSTTNCANSSYNSWGIRFGVAGTQTNIMRFMYANNSADPCVVEYQDIMTFSGTGTITDVNIYRNVTISNLSGSGNALTKLDSTGKLIRDELDDSGSGSVNMCYNKTTKDIYLGTPGC